MDRIINLDTFYLKIKKLILIAKGYTEMRYLDTLITMCRLKPYPLPSNYKHNKVELRRWWIDEYGNSLQITDKKKLQITLNDLRIDRLKLVNTDLYHGLPIHKVYAMSKFAFFFVGKEEGLLRDYYIVSLLGLDDYLRTFVFIDGEWKKYPPLYLGFVILKRIAMNAGQVAFKELKHKDTVIYPCQRQQAWLCSLPMPEELKKALNETNLIEAMGIK